MIILTLQGGIGAILIKDMPKIGRLFSIIDCIFILSVLCLTLSILSVLRAYYLKEWVLVPDSHHLIEEYGGKK